MKNLIITLFTSSLMTATAHADQQLSDLRIRTYDNRPVIVRFNQYRYQTPGTWVNINDVPAGRHFIQVWTMASPYSAGNGRRLIYSGTIDVPGGAEVRAMVTRNNTLRINQVIPLAPEPDGMDPADPYLPYPVHCGTPPPPACIHPETFQDLLLVIEQQDFESTRMQLAKQAIRQHGVISTLQVIELMRTMHFESSKLELAKFAYAYTADPGNYFRLYNEFTFDSSVRELSAFIG